MYTHDYIRMTLLHTHTKCVIKYKSLRLHANVPQIKKHIPEIISQAISDVISRARVRYKNRQRM